MKELTQTEKDLIIAEAVKRAESKRPKEYIKVIEPTNKEWIKELQLITDSLTDLITEGVRETFRIELNPNPLVTDPDVVKKKEGPHTLILPLERAKVNPRGVIITGIMNHYLNQDIIPKEQRQGLLDLLMGNISNYELTAKKAPRKARTSSKPKTTRTPRAKKEDNIEKISLEWTSDNKGITLAEICKEINLDPKKARVKLRKHFIKPDSGWQWSIDHKQYIIEFLTK